MRSRKRLHSPEPCNSTLAEQKRITVKSERKRAPSRREAQWLSACEKRWPRASEMAWLPQFKQRGRQICPDGRSGSGCGRGRQVHSYHVMEKGTKE